MPLAQQVTKMNYISDKHKRCDSERHPEKHPGTYHDDIQRGTRQDLHPHENRHLS